MHTSGVQDDNVRGNGKEREEMKQDTDVPLTYLQIESGIWHTVVYVMYS